MNNLANTPGSVPTDPERLLTFNEGCDFIQMSRRWVAQRLNEIPHIRLGKRIRFRRGALMAYCQSKEKGGKEP